MRRRRLFAMSDGRWGRIRGLRASVGVVSGDNIERERSGRAVVKRTTSHKSSSGGSWDMVVFTKSEDREAAEAVGICDALSSELYTGASISKHNPA